MSNKEAAAHNATAPYKSHIEFTPPPQKMEKSLYSRLASETL